jgi:hypothetical protein
LFSTKNAGIQLVKKFHHRKQNSNKKFKAIMTFPVKLISLSKPSLKTVS